MALVTFDLPLQLRAAAFDADVDTEKRQVRFSFSSDAPVPRKLGDGSDELIYEVLDHNREAIDTSRLDAKAVPFLDSHDWKKPLGKIVEYGVRDGKGYAVARISRSAEGEQALNDIRDQIRTEISVGYFVHSMQPDGEYQGKRQFRAAKWQPYEISLVSVPQDYRVGIGRGGVEETMPCTIEMGEERAEQEEDHKSQYGDVEYADKAHHKYPIDTKAHAKAAWSYINMEKNAKFYSASELKTIKSRIKAALKKFGVAVSEEEDKREAQVDLDEEVISAEETPDIMAETATKVEVVQEDIGKLRELEFSRMREIRAIGDKFHVSEEADKYIRGGRSLADFNQWLLSTQFKQGDQIRTIDPYLGQKPQQRQRYNLCKAIMAKADGVPLPGYEREMHEEVARQTGRQAEGFFVPDFVWMGDGFRRDLGVTTGPGLGGELVQQIVEPSLVEYLRNVIVTARAGATVMTGLRDNIAIPRQIATATSSWVAETAALTTSNVQFDQVLLAPNRIGATTQYTRQLLIQGVLDINNIVRDDLFETIGHQIDYVAFNGTGVGAQPAGILHTPADTVWPSNYSKTSPSVVFSGSGYATWTQIVQFESNVESNNVYMEHPSVHYCVAPQVKGQFKTLAKADPRSTSLYYPSFFWESDDTINGYPAIASNQLSTHQVVFGKFNQLILAYWGGTDVVVDPFTKATSGEIAITMNLFVDVALRHSPSFCYSTTAPFGT